MFSVFSKANFLKIFLLLLLSVTLQKCQTHLQLSTPPSTEMKKFFASPEYGVQASFWWDPIAIDQSLFLIKDMNFQWVKQTFAWRDIEGIKDAPPDWWRTDIIVNKIEEYNLKLLVRIERPPFWAQEDGGAIPLENAPPKNYNLFGNFCGLLAERYKGRISAYQIWNEPNLSREWGGMPPNPLKYVELLKVCYQAIKKADPNAIVISAGLAPTGTSSAEAMPDVEFLQAMYDAGASSYFDVLGVHAPGYKAPPELDPNIAENSASGYGGGRWFTFRHVEDLREIMVINGDAQKQIAILEMGWIIYQEIHPTYTWHGVTEKDQADYLVRAYKYAQQNWQPWIGLMITIYFADKSWTPETHEQWWWSIVLPDGTPRLAYKELQNMPK